MSAPGFWDNQEAAAKVSADHSRTSRRLEEFRSLTAEVEDLDSLAEMALEDPRDRAPSSRAARADRGAAGDARGAAAVLGAL